jgi:hypothetical protein
MALETYRTDIIYIIYIYLPLVSQKDAVTLGTSNYSTSLKKNNNSYNLGWK